MPGSKSSSVRTIQPTGALTAAKAEQFTQELLDAITTDRVTELKIDMSQVEALDSAGLVSLMTALKTAQSRRKQLSLYAVPPSILIVFELTQLDQVFNLVDQSPASTAIAA
jgi:anti-anti-sigma factor